MEIVDFVILSINSMIAYFIVFVVCLFNPFDGYNEIIYCILKIITKMI